MCAAGAVFTNDGLNNTLYRMYGTVKAQATLFGIGTGTTTPAKANVSLETTITAWNAGADTKAFLSGYPSVDEVNNEVTTRGQISASQANGNTISECIELGTDTTATVYTHDVFTGIAKNSKVEIILELVHGVT